MNGTHWSPQVSALVEGWSDAVGGVTVPPDVLFRALAAPERRNTLWYLLKERRTTVETLTDVLLGWHVEATPVVGDDDRDRLSTTLHHVHLPVLADCGLVVHDTAAGTVELAPLSPATRDVVRLACRYDTVTTPDTTSQ